ncbi:MAG: hypothetical protein EOP84_21540 [Verrucomicrobiaceae bacterium]|nr:MAG: hypothetical protein EOP84_21540 [Verrucomicrobiaceae bacterium]
MFAVAVYAAFFSPFSQAVEGELRNTVAEKSVEKIQLTAEVSRLQTEVRIRVQAIDQESKELLEQQIALDQMLSAKDAAMKSLQALQPESSVLKSNLRDQYRKKYLVSLRWAWLDAPVPAIFVDAMNGTLKGSGDPSAAEIGSQIYITSFQALSKQGAEGLDREVALELQQTVLRNCGDQKLFSHRFLTQFVSADERNSTRVELVSKAATLFKEICLT